MAGKGSKDKDAGRDGVRRLRPDQDLPAVVGVDERTADYDSDDQSNEPGQAGDTDGGRRSRERVDLNVDRDPRELMTGRRDSGAGPEQPEVTRNPERAQVYRETTKTLPHYPTLTGRT